MDVAGRIDDELALQQPAHRVIADRAMQLADAPHRVGCRERPRRCRRRDSGPIGFVRLLLMMMTRTLHLRAPVNRAIDGLGEFVRPALLG